MVKLRITLFSFAAIFLLSSCDYGLQEAFGHYNTVQARTQTLTEKDAPSTITAADSTYDILVISDVHFGKPNKTRHEDDLLTWLSAQSTKPKFCICLGDIADHGLESEYRAYAAFLSSLGIPAYTTVGNHDLYNSGWGSFIQFVDSTSFYHFATAGMSYYFLDSGSGTLGYQQFEKLKERFATDSLPKLVFTHYPIARDKVDKASYFQLQNSEECAQLITLFAQNNVKMVAVGHTHDDYVTNLGSYIELNITSFLKDDEWCVITVNETGGSASYKRIKN